MQTLETIMEAIAYYEARLQEVRAAFAALPVVADASDTPDFSINAAMKQRVILSARKAALAEETKAVNASLDANETEVKAYLVHNDMQSVKVNGLFNASLVNKTYYADTGEFKAWALVNDPLSLTIAVKQSGVAAYLADNNDVLPPGLKASNLVTVSFRKLK